MIRYLADVATPLHASGAQGTFSMDNCRTRCIQLSQEDVDKGTSRTTIRLGKGFSCLCGRFRCHNWKFFNAVVGAELYWLVYYVSRKLSTTERNYSTTEREALGMIYNINKFCHYLLGHKFIFHVDHSTLFVLTLQTRINR